MKFTDILGFEFANGTLPETVEYAMKLMSEGESCTLMAPDSELVRNCRRDRRLRNALSDAEMILPTGNSIMFASKILGIALEQRISPIDFCSALLARMSEKEMRLFILGNEQNTVELACENITRRYPGLKLLGSEDGYYSNDDDIVEIINRLKPDLVIVSKNRFEQERWMHRYRNSIDTGLLFGLGDELKYYAGLEPRAPKRWRDSGFEWFYWIMKRPDRILNTVKQSWIILVALHRKIFGT